MLEMANGIYFFAEAMKPKVFVLAYLISFIMVNLPSKSLKMILLKLTFVYLTKLKTTHSLFTVIFWLYKVYPPTDTADLKTMVLQLATPNYKVTMSVNVE